MESSPSFQHRDFGPVSPNASFVRVARNSLRVGRTLIQRWWGEAVLAKVRLHAPMDYFRIADHA
jgi:hypothetical protein